MARMKAGFAARIAAAAIAMAAAAFPLAARAQDAPKGDAANGKKVYVADGCFECHGHVGQGGMMNGPAPVIAETELPFEAFKSQLRDPANDMPPYPDTLLSDKDLTDIFAYLRALPRGRPVKDAPILND
jgi:mono/diheme cytochrome c family protein